MPIQIVRAIKRKVYHALNLERVSDKFGLLALNFIFLMACFNLESIFVNTLLLRVSDGDMRTVLVYRSVLLFFRRWACLLLLCFQAK